MNTRLSESTEIKTQRFVRVTTLDILILIHPVDCEGMHWYLKWRKLKQQFLLHSYCNKNMIMRGHVGIKTGGSWR